MSRPLGVQLYTVRDALAADFQGTIEKIAAMGYAGVETAGMYGDSPASAVELFQRLGLQVSSAHSGLPLGDNRNQVLETMAILGTTNLVVPYLPPEEFKSIDSIKAVCDRLNEGNKVAREAGLSMLYHNHAWEYEPVDGQLPYQLMLEWLDPSIDFEVDAYWVKVGGQDPIAVLKEMGRRARLLHVKDGSANKDDPMTAVGQGSLDYTSIIPAAESAEWMLVELDRCATDMMTAVEESAQYLTAKGLAHGR